MTEMNISEHFAFQKVGYNWNMIHCIEYLQTGKFLYMSR